MSVSLQINLNENLYLRNPQQTELGKKIIQHGIVLIDEIGFEKFTFRKLAERIDSTEASIYRYFENKHKFLIYLTSWYWEYVKYQLEVRSNNISDPMARLRIAIDVLLQSSLDDPATDYVNESVLHRIVIEESLKAYHTKDVDQENKVGFFANYKTFCRKIQNIILEIKPDFPYPGALASNLVEMSMNHFYYAQHLPSLTSIAFDDKVLDNLAEMIHFFVNKILEQK